MWRGYTFPCRDIAFPLGLNGSRRPLRETIDPTAFLSIPYLVAVGEVDTELDRGLRLDPEIVDLQGTTRVERATKWVETRSGNPAKPGTFGSG